MVAAVAAAAAVAVVVVVAVVVAAAAAGEERKPPTLFASRLAPPSLCTLSCLSLRIGVGDPALPAMQNWVAVGVGSRWGRVVVMAVMEEGVGGAAA